MDLQNAVAMHRGTWCFGGFVLDHDRAALTDAAGRIIVLRPKTLALLECLLAQAGQVISRDALLDAVWRDVTVTDESLSQAVSELRQALGDGRSLIRTVPRRGYMLDAETTRAPPGPAAEAAGAVETDPAAAAPAPRHGGRRAWWRRPIAWILPLALLIGPSDAPGPGHVAGARAEKESRIRGVLIAPVAARHPDADRLHAAGRAVVDGPGDVAETWIAARRLFEEAITANPNLAPAHAEAAITYANAAILGFSPAPKEDVGRAERLARRAIELAPHLAAAHLAQGLVLRLQRRPLQATASFRLALTLDPDLHQARANLGLMLVLIGRPQEAIAALELVIAAAPRHRFVGSWHAYLGLARLHHGDGDHGAADFRAAIEICNAAPPELLRLHLASALALSGAIGEARRLAAELRRQHPALTATWLRSRPLSDHPVYLAQREATLRGLALAGGAD